MAKQKIYSSGQPPSPWAIVLVAALLILMPTLFCGGIFYMASNMKSPDANKGEKLEIHKPKDASP
jgi:hypothetical protein